jgi:hypothetical protein
MGLRLGEAQDRHNREKAYQEDRARALLQAQADIQADDQLLAAQQQREVAAVPGAVQPGFAGPMQPEVESKQKEIVDRFAYVRDVAKRMSPQHRERYLLEQKAEFQKAATDKARKTIASGIQDRVAQGSYNFLDETEPNPEIDARLEAITTALDDPNSDPLKVADLDAELLKTVREHNKKLLARNRGTAMIDGQLQKAVDSGNSALASSLEELKAMWGTGELDADDLVDKLFEAQYGRKTARASGPTPYQVRQDAIKLWQATAMKPGLPSEEELAPYLEMVGGPPPAVPLKRADVIKNATGGGAPAPTEVDPGVAKRQGEKIRVAKTEREEQAGRAAKAQPKAAAAEQRPQGGRPPRPWAKLGPKERQQAEKDLLAVARKGGDLRAALFGLGILDPDSLPAALIRKLRQLGKESRQPTTVGRPQHQGPSQQMIDMAMGKGRRQAQ